MAYPEKKLYSRKLGRMVAPKHRKARLKSLRPQKSTDVTPSNVSNKQWLYDKNTNQHLQPTSFKRYSGKPKKKPLVYKKTNKLNRKTWFHGTNKQSFDLIKENGFKPEKGLFGKGVYFSDTPSFTESYGGKKIKVNLKSMKIFDFSTDKQNKIWNEYIVEGKKRGVTFPSSYASERIKKDGYDAIKTQEYNGRNNKVIKNIVVFNTSKIEFVDKQKSGIESNKNSESLLNNVNLKRQPVGVGISKNVSGGNIYYDLTVKYADGGTVGVEMYDSLKEAKDNKQKLIEELRRKMR